MRKTRVYINSNLTSGEIVVVDQETSHHLANVLKIRKGESVNAFDGSGGYFEAEIINQDKKSISILPGKFVDDKREPAIKLTLAQALVRGQKMDYVIQKAVEVGVHRIVPLLMEFCNVKLEADRLKNRMGHWQKIIINACEQCGRNILPEISSPVELSSWVNQDESPLRLALLPDSGLSINNIKGQDGNISLICGPEGGFSEEEVESCNGAGYQALSLGPRILRTETAAVAGLVICQSRWGDMR